MPSKTGKSVFIAIDLGASNGRIIIGELRHQKLDLTVAYRFDHGIIERDGLKRWDWSLITAEIDCGLVKACELIGKQEIASICCDSWAQDFGLLDADGRLFYAPASYRDSRTDGLPEGFSEIIAPAELVRRCGSIVSPVTTLCQLRAMAQNEPEVLKNAATLLFIGDLVHYRLCGTKVTDLTYASASQARNLKSGTWDDWLLGELGVSARIMPPINNSPSVIGRVSAESAPHAKLVGVPVVNGAGHDTAAATGVIQPMSEGTLFMSLGTWAMLGACINAPLVKPAYNTSAAIFGLLWNTWGLFQGGAGMWPYQECVKLWQASGEFTDYNTLEHAAAEMSISDDLDFNDPRFFAPDNMLAEIQQARAEMGLPVPSSPAETVAIIANSLALGFKGAVTELSQLTGMRFDTLRLFSGGSRSDYFCSRLAQALGIPVIAGPAEATAVGNILTQARTVGALTGTDELNTVINNSFVLKTYEA